jgi:hypothetical protein
MFVTVRKVPVFTNSTSHVPLVILSDKNGLKVLNIKRYAWSEEGRLNMRWIQNTDYDPTATKDDEFLLDDELYWVGIPTHKLLAWCGIHSMERRLSRYELISYLQFKGVSED